MGNILKSIMYNVKYNWRVCSSFQGESLAPVFTQ